MRLLSKALVAVAICLGAAALAGCHSRPEPPAVNFHLSSAADLEQIRRVVLLELPEDPNYAGVAGDTTVALAEALRERRLFRVEIFARDADACRDLSLDSQGGYTMAQLRAMRESLQCDAVLIGEMRNFLPHPAMRMGLDLQLLDLRQGKVVWAVDYTWDTGDKRTEKRIRKYFRHRMRSGLEPMEWQLVMISPKAFEEFVAYETAKTLHDVQEDEEEEQSEAAKKVKK